jgi:hypothetical protein
MDCIGINNFLKKNYFLFNYIITKIDDCKIDRQINIETFL